MTQCCGTCKHGRLVNVQYVDCQHPIVLKIVEFANQQSGQPPDSIEFGCMEKWQGRHCPCYEAKGEAGK